MLTNIIWNKQKNEMINYIVNKYRKLVQKENKTGRDWLEKVIVQEIKI